MADERVRDVQKWLNQTYGKVSGYEKVRENGVTGWSTIYSLREGLQHELKITDLGQGFGTKTRAALRKVIKDIVPGTTGNIVKLIKGAFWCKGIGPTNFTDTFDSPLYNAIKVLQGDAGVTTDGLLSVNLMAALFDMSAFVLIAGRGDKRIREIQQELNGKYSSTGNDDDEGLGILPCDGIYQRDTNTALIYALQVVLKVKNPNGNYGPGTISATPTVNPGESGEIVRIIQYGLYVNGFYTGEFNANYDDNVASSVIAFRKFMNLPEFTGISDLTVIKGLLTSNGNTDRDSNMFDTSTPLTDQDVLNMKTYGFSISGRYLTGSVGTGSEKRDKNLTSEEIQRITLGGLSIFPIYEDGGYDLKYFNASQGFQDAFIAANTARTLGFPQDTTIYFAVDVDVQEGDIAGTIEPYLTAVVDGLSGTEFHPGIYGTRNVCLHGEELGMKYSFVADMSYGWSGNLGFKMPTNWAFDQFVEYSIGGTPIDQGASSGKDSGVKAFTPRPPQAMTSDEALKTLEKSLGDNESKLTFNHELTLVDEPYLKATIEAEAEFKNTGSNPIFTIKNGKFDSVSISDYLIEQQGFPKVCAKLMVDQLGQMKLSEKVSFGNMSIEVGTGSENLYKVSFIYNASEVEGKVVTGGISFTFAVEVEPITFIKEKMGDIYAKIASKLSQFIKPIALIIAVGLLVALAVCSSVEIAIATAIAFIITVIKHLIPITK